MEDYHFGHITKLTQIFFKIKIKLGVIIYLYWVGFPSHERIYFVNYR
jgi:hypothetical protein